MGLSSLRNRKKATEVAQVQEQIPVFEQKVEEPIFQPKAEEPVFQKPVQEPVQTPVHSSVVNQQPAVQEVIESKPVQQEVKEPNTEARFQHIENGKVYDTALTPLKSVEVAEFNYSNPDNLGLQILGLNNTEKVKLIKPKTTGIKPVEITNIVDSTGAVAAKLMRYMEKTSATVLPLRECGVFENIVAIKGFKIISIRGKKFASYCGQDFPKIYVDKLMQKIINKISSAMPYGVEEDIDGVGGYIWNKAESRLSRVVAINGREVEIPALCNSEIEYIYAKFAPYHCNIIDVTDDFSHIIVGVDLEGVGYSEREL